MDHIKSKVNGGLQDDKFNLGKFFSQLDEAVNESYEKQLPTLRLQFLIDDYQELKDDGTFNK